MQEEDIFSGMVLLMMATTISTGPWGCLLVMGMMRVIDQALMLSVTASATRQAKICPGRVLQSQQDFSNSQRAV
jgi:hypothetical protein